MGSRGRFLSRVHKSILHRMKGNMRHRCEFLRPTFVLSNQAVPPLSAPPLQLPTAQKFLAGCRGGGGSSGGSSSGGSRSGSSAAAALAAAHQSNTQPQRPQTS
jgi:hypothetical protein